MAFNKNSKLVSKNPCHKKWEELDGIGSSKFCESCQHSVIDFTEKTEQEIIDFVCSTKGRVCGRIGQNQITRVVLTKSSDSGFLKKFVGFVVGLALTTPLTSGLFAENSSTNEKHKTQVFLNRLDQPKQSINLANQQDSVVEIKGTVLDSATGEPLPQAIVFIKNTTIGASTNDSGEYYMKVLAKSIPENARIIFQFLGFERKEEDLLEILKEGKVTLKMEPFDQEEVFVGIIHVPFHTRVWYSIKSIFVRDPIKMERRRERRQDRRTRRDK